jgi:hypothetical protein
MTPVFSRLFFYVKATYKNNEDVDQIFDEVIIYNKPQNTFTNMQVTYKDELKKLFK